MELSPTAINKILRTYQTQNRIADLNRQRPIKVVQGQVDRVDISPKARQLSQNPPAVTLGPLPETAPAPAPSEESSFTPLIAPEETSPPG